jgi:hypothetical protein
MNSWANAQWRKSTRSAGNGGECVEVAAARWRKSTRSTSGGECVEVADDFGGLVGVRDSKDLAGPVLAFAPKSWTTFVAGVKVGRPGR